MASLGSFGAAQREYDPGDDPDTFEFCGETFTVRGPIPGMVQLAIGASISGRTSGSDYASAIWDALQYALTAPAREEDGEMIAEDDSDWLRFHQLATTSRVETEVIAKVAYELLGAQDGRPTERRSTSSTGSSPTSTSSSSSS